MSGSMSGRWRRGMVQLMGHRQTKGPVTVRQHLNYRATSRLHSFHLQCSKQKIIIQGVHRIEARIRWETHRSFCNETGQAVRGPCV